MLNDKPLFQVGPLDQGCWPDGLYTAPTDEALKYDIEITKKLGFNMIRKHVKVEPDALVLLVRQARPARLAGHAAPATIADDAAEAERIRASSSKRHDRRACATIRRS